MRLSVGLLALLLGAVLFAFGQWRAQELREELSLMESEIAQAEGLVLENQVLQRRIEELARLEEGMRLKALRGAYPDLVLARVLEAARRSGVRVLSLRQAGLEDLGHGLYQAAFVLELSGRYPNLVRFWEEVAALPGMPRVESLAYEVRGEALRSQGQFRLLALGGDR